MKYAPVAQRSGRFPMVASAYALGLLFAGAAQAAVTQPDGREMPLPAPSNEVSLQELFDLREGPGAISAHDDASTQPATFKPLCDFTAQLLLHETGARSAVGWYNVTASGPGPTTVCDEATGMSSSGSACAATDIFVLVPGDVAEPPFGRDASPLDHPGKVFTGSEIAQSPYYAGGEIGFVLLTDQRHYSESRLNPACTDAAKCELGAHFIPTIMYQSKATPRGFYMCSEDQFVGANDEWGGNDGDFNDFVFMFSGLVCSGSGEACDTGLPGVCAAGLTDCRNAAGESECKPARSSSAEACNGMDDDCNGETDEGELCDDGELCVKGRCVPRCGSGEFRCPESFSCVQGACVESSCAKMECEAGKVCMGGKCVGECDEVTCPHGQVCQSGSCNDPCRGLDCGEGLVCEGGACVVACSCAGCENGACDSESGHCLADGCSGVTCGAGEHCAAGDCLDDCEGAVCPGGAVCTLGECGPALSTHDDDGEDEPQGAAGEKSGGLGPIGQGSTGGTNASDPGGTDAGGTGAATPVNQVDSAKGCACRAAGPTNGAPASALFVLAAVFGGLVRRRASNARARRA